MLVYFSTVFRTAPLERGGELVCLDWEKQRILRRQPIVPASPIITDPNPRGGTRGGRGILLAEDEALVASYHSIHSFDRDLRAGATISSGNFADIHAMAWDGDDIWVTSTVLDGLIKVNRAGEVLDSWWPREDSVVASRYGLKRLKLDKNADNRLAYLGRSHIEPGHTHLNAVAVRSGRPLVLLNRLGCVVQLYPTRVLVEDPALEGAHDIVVHEDGRLFINDTRGHAIRMYDPDGKFLQKICLKRFSPVRKIFWRFWARGLRIWLGERSPSFRIGWWLMKDVVASRPIFVRGLCLTPYNTLLVGISPATILEIDWQTNRLVRCYRYSTDVNCAVHGLACSASLPREVRLYQQPSDQTELRHYNAAAIA